MLRKRFEVLAGAIGAVLLYLLIQVFKSLFISKKALALLYP